MNRDEKINRICDELRFNTKEERLELAQIIYSDNKMKSLFQEKGDGVVIKIRHITDEMLDKMIKKISEHNKISE